MMFKVNDIFLDFDGDIELERQVKLFEDISETQGDFSYGAKMAKTSNNITALGIPIPDSISKIVYTQIPAILYDNQGNELQRGALRVESIEEDGINFSFFSGNSNWISLLTGDMTELRLSQYDVDINFPNISASWANTSGIIFPLIDTGTIITRGFYNVMLEDFVGCFFVHTLLKEVFQQSGIKIQGELLQDPFFLSLVLASNARSINDVNDSKFYVGTDTDQPVPASTNQDITFEDQTDTPFYLGEHITVVGNKDFYVSSRMVVDIEIMTQSDINLITHRLMKNGVHVRASTFKYKSTTDSDNNKVSIIIYGIELEAGDYITAQAINNYGVTVTLTNAYFKITPKYIFKTFGKSAVPLWTKQEFVSNVLKLFCTVSSFDPITRTLTINLFDKIKEKEPIDISEFIKIDSIDYSEFISNYGASNTFSYQESDDEDLGEYNISSFVKYGAGVISCDNEFVEKSAEVVDSAFSAPISYFNQAFEVSLERIHFTDFDEGESGEVTSVTNSGTDAVFNITDADEIFAVDDRVRIETDIVDYNGDYIVTNVTSTHIVVLGNRYTSDATGTITILTHKLTDDDSVYLFSVTKETSTEDLFKKPEVFIEFDKTSDTFVLAFFNIIKSGRTFEDDYKQSLSFDIPNRPSSYQRSLLSKYWNQLDRILQDPVKLLSTTRYPLTVYRSIDFLRPLMIKTLETSNLYFPNRITEFPDGNSETELIKLS